MGLTQRLGVLADVFQPDSSLNVGIGGAANSSYKLTVTGTTLTTGAATFSSSVQATTMSIGIAPQTDKLFVYNASGTNTGLTIQQDGTGDIFRANGNSGANRFVVQQGGNVGIGTSSPNDKLEVSGGFIRLSATAGNGPQFNLYSNGQTSNHVTLAQGFALATDNIGYLYNRANADFVFGTNNTERMRITSAGNVCIGTTTSSGYGNVNLDLNAGSLPAAYFVIKTASGGCIAEYALDSGAAYLSTKTSHDLVFRTSDTERYRITNSGIIDIKNTFISWSYDNQGIKLSKSGVGPKIALWSNTQYLYLGYGESGGWERVYAQATSAGVYLTNGATSWTGNSDERLKNINSNIENATDKLNTLRTIKYSWKDDELNREYLGLIAQDVQKVLPEVIDIDDKDEMKTLGVRYTELIPVLIAAIKELSAKVTALENR